MAMEGGNSGIATGGNYDVFLSFRGPDTRNTFTDCLYVFMSKAGIRIFRDDEELWPGEKISEILRAVKSSQIYIPIFSKNYASSRWCLRELTCMVKSYDQFPGKQILPIFYDVDPRDVKLETEQYKSALTKHEEELGCSEVNPWKEALTTVARIKGWHLKDQRQGEVIDDIIKRVLQKITIRKRDLPTYLVGIDDRIEDIKKLLNCCDTSDVRFVIIYGIGGMGKTTLAKVVFNQFSPQFEGHSFLSSIQESSPCRGIVKMQRKLVADLFNFSLPKTCDFEEGNNMIRKRLPNKRVLLVFDGIDENNQSMQLAKYCTLCGPGSRIIITTRDKSAFPTKVEGFEEHISTGSTETFLYEMKEMRYDHALQFFNNLAFSTDSVPPDLYDLSREVVALTGGLPLAVEVIGSHLHGQSKAQWISILEKLKEVPHEKVQQRLKISYDALEYRPQQIFLDIACFFVNKKKTNPMYMWEDSGFYPKVEIEVLIDKSLIKIVDHDRIWMHDQLRTLGREIVRQEHMWKSEDRSRLWYLEMIHEKGTQNAVALTPRRSGDNFPCKDFADLTKARFLKLDGGNFAGNFEDILSELRWLCWRNCPPELKANNFVLNRLVILKLSGDIILDKWSGWVEIMVASKLKVLKIARSNSLIKTPCFSEFLSLERLVLKGFPNLVQIDHSIGKLERLMYLKIKWCPFLRWLPQQIGYLTALRELILIQGFSIRHLPDSIGNLRLLSRLVVEDTGLVELPNTIKGLADLEYLCLANCTSLNSLLDAVGELKSLTELDLSGTTIEELPQSIYNHEDLTLQINSSKIRTRLMRDLPPLEGIEDCLDSIRLKADWKSALKNLKEEHLENARQKFMRAMPYVKLRQKFTREVLTREVPSVKLRHKFMREVPLEKVRQKLVLIYEGLDYGEKQIFLDIASFFLNKKKTDTVCICKACDLFPKVEMDALVNKSLIKILDRGKIWMHDQVRDFGREIIRQENIEISRDQSRLQFLKTVNEKILQKQVTTLMQMAGFMVTLSFIYVFIVANVLKFSSTASREDQGMATIISALESDYCRKIFAIGFTISMFFSATAYIRLIPARKSDYHKAVDASTHAMALQAIADFVILVTITIGIQTSPATAIRRWVTVLWYLLLQLPKFAPFLRTSRTLRLVFSMLDLAYIN
ncbi:disease resistance protein L6-like isoform X2 [Syzygium oleosum]|uniref:disease resistance protein L6-like isoform X2 n=1 Tax=Syzygium oleosum TaxID=219896 RepID=UPI0024BBC582|nr:disease resistance protein L6-like isoform X2 [Syzygium oleosum]